MGTYRKEWPCCDSVTETQAWEPESCPFCTQDAAPAAANGALTDEQIMRISCDMKQRNAGVWPGDVAYARAILAAAGPDAALVKALESALAIINNEADPDEYAAPLKIIRAALSGAKGN